MFLTDLYTAIDVLVRYSYIVFICIYVPEVDSPQDSKPMTMINVRTNNQLNKHTNQLVIVLISDNSNVRNV